MTGKCLDYPQKIQRKIQKAIGTQKVEAKGSLEVIPLYQKKKVNKQRSKPMIMVNGGNEKNRWIMKF